MTFLKPPHWFWWFFCGFFQLKWALLIKMCPLSVVIVVVNIFMFVFRTTVLNSTKHGTKHPWMKEIPRGDNNDSDIYKSSPESKLGLRVFNIFFLNEGQSFVIMEKMIQLIFFFYPVCWYNHSLTPVRVFPKWVMWPNRLDFHVNKCTRTSRFTLHSFKVLLILNVKQVKRSIGLAE